MNRHWMRHNLGLMSSIARRITRVHPEPMICQVAAELGLMSHPDAADEYVWNGYPVSLRFLRGPENSEPSLAVIEICTGTAGRLLVRKSSSMSRLLRRWLRRDVGRIESGLEILAEPDELRVRLFSEPVMAKTLPLAITRNGDEIRMSDGRLRVTRYCVDRVVADALKSGWSLATGVVEVLGLVRP